MGPVRQCSVDESLVDIDIRAGEFLKFEVSFSGARIKFAIADEEGRVLMSDASPRVGGTYTAEWPPAGGWAWDGADSHAFVGVMAGLVSCRIRVLLCRASGTTKQVVRDCKFTKKNPHDVAFELWSVFVAKEAGA